MVKTVNNGGADMCYYNIIKITGLQDDTALQSHNEYSGSCYAPDGYDDVNFGPQLRSMIDDQVRNIKTLQFKDQDMGLTQSTFAFNSYYQVDDGGNYASTFWSIIYDTRGLTAEEAGARTYLYTPGYGYVANTYPDRDIMQGQYVSFMYRQPTNAHEMESWSLGNTYCYMSRATPEDPEYWVIENQTLDSSLTGQSFRYSGTADWQVWGNNNGNLRWAQFWIADPKGNKTYITPKLYPKWCEEPNTMYLYYVNSMGGIDFVRGTYATYSSYNTERESYETNADIDDRLAFGQEIYSQRRWNSYVFHTDIMSDEESYNMADLVTARWAWIRIPDEVPEWRSVRITDTSAKLKLRKNEGQKIYSYTFNLEDATKSKIV